MGSRRLIAGMSGWGKSYHFQAILEATLRAFFAVLVLDYKDEYRGLVKAGLMNHLIVGPKELRYSSDDWEQILLSNPRLVVVRHRLSPDQWQTVAARMVKAIRRISNERGVDTLTGIDEAHFVFPQKGSVPQPLVGLATTGRGEGAQSMYVTQRLAKMEEDIISQCDEMLVGGFSSDADRAKIDPEYPEELHNPERRSSLSPGQVPSELLVDGEGKPLRLFTDDDGETVGSEWIYSDNEGNRERRDTSTLTMESNHYGGSSADIVDPAY